MKDNGEEEEVGEGNVGNLRIHFIRTRKSIEKSLVARTLLLWEELRPF